MDRRLFGSIQLILTLFLTLHVSSALEARKTGKLSLPSVFSLFNLKEKSKFWTESVLHGADFDDLESSLPERTSVVNFTKAGNIASYLRVREVDSVYIPIPVNFIFIGFEGKGNQEFKLEPEELERWFTKIDHIFEHTRVARIEEALINSIRVALIIFSVHAIEMSEKVTSLFEHAIHVLSRKDDVSGDRDDGTVIWQVDVDNMDIVFSSLVEYLQLENAYNIFILNPKHDKERPKYGYRRGLSLSEIHFLKENKSLQAEVLHSGTIPDDGLELDKIKRPLYEKHPMSKFSWAITEDTDTVEWYHICLDALNKVEKLNQGKDTAKVIQGKVMQLLKGKNEDLKLVLEKELKSGDLSGLHPDSLTDTWIGKERWAFIDLSAGPFSWGPAVGGEGVRTELTLPNVEKNIGAVAGNQGTYALQHWRFVSEGSLNPFGDDPYAFD